jgi:hypothetical protein
MTKSALKSFELNLLWALCSRRIANVARRRKYALKLGGFVR